MNKYGLDNFTFEVLERTENGPERESYYIKLYNSFYHGYNETLGGDGRRYIVLSEAEVCNYYLKNNNLLHTAQYFQHDIAIIRDILLKNNIDILPSPEVTRRTRSKAVAKIDLKTGEVIQIYPSVSEARKLHNEAHISEVCCGKRHASAGYGWKFIDEV